jgi:hypothetical protein
MLKIKGEYEMKNLKVGNIVSVQGIVSARFELVGINNDTALVKLVQCIDGNIIINTIAHEVVISKIKKARPQSSYLSRTEKELILKRNYHS